VTKDDKRGEAAKLYIRKSLTCRQIAAELGVNEGTVYRWKSEAAEAGEASDWDAARRVYNMSPREIAAIYAEGLKTWVVQLKQNPDLYADGKVADAIVKHVSVLQKIDARSQYLGAVLELIETANRWLEKNQPELKMQIAPYWESIYQEMAERSARKDLF
jgi:AcrR family transcriptional regulator